VIRETEEDDTMTDLAQLGTAIEAGDATAARSLTCDALEDGTAATEVLDAMTRSMAAIGERFEAGDVYVSGMLVAARAMKEALIELEPALVEAGVQPEHTVVIGTVQGDLHDIGKGLVSMMLKGANLEVVDLGTNVPAERFVEAARQHDAAVIGLSALLTTTMTSMADVVEAVRASDVADTKIIVGGAPVTEEYAIQIGADGFATDAARAVDVVRRALGMSPDAVRLP
jgi:5-methyltetrahydrofolate--homocysteine methyltransferase